MEKSNASHSQASNSQSGRVVLDDSSSPYFLQNGDHPGLVLVSHSFAGNNYHTWSRVKSMALTAKNKLGFVDGTFLCVLPLDLSYGFWIRCNNMVISWLLNAVSREIADSLMYIATAHEIWIDLHERFDRSIFQIKKLLTGLQRGSMDVSTYYTRLRTLWDELKDFQLVSVCSCGSMKDWVKHQSRDCVMQFLMGLNESYAQIPAQVLMMDPIPAILKIFSLVVQEECQRSIHSDISGSSLDHTSLLSPNPSTAAIKGSL